MIKKYLFFLIFFISSISHTNSFILLSQQSWFERLWEFCTSVYAKASSYAKATADETPDKALDRTVAKQQAMINQFHNEYDNTLNQMAKDLGISDHDWQEFLKRHAEKKEAFLKSLEIARKDYYHDPELSREDKELVIDACKIYGFNPEAIDIKFANLDKLINAKVESINHCPTVIVDKRYWNSTSEDRKFSTLLHELGHLMEDHHVTEEILLANLGLYNRLRMRIMKMLFSEKTTVSYMQHKEAMAEIIGDCKSQSHNKLKIQAVLEEIENTFKNTSKNTIKIAMEKMAEEIYSTKNPEGIEIYQKELKESKEINTFHLNYLEKFYLHRLIYHRIWADDSEKTIDDIIKYDKRCNEAPLIKSTFEARTARK